MAGRWFAGTNSTDSTFDSYALAPFQVWRVYTGFPGINKTKDYLQKMVMQGDLG
jgi:hypothetical protein